jgi:valyl-tRNA synthetase
MPFITEEIWSRIKTEDDTDIIVSEWPDYDNGMIFSEAADYTVIFKEIIYKIRNIRGEMNIPPDKKASVVFKSDNALMKRIIEKESVHIQALAKVESIKLDSEYSPDKSDASAVMPDLEIYLPLSGLIDIEKETARLEKEIAKIKADLEKVVAKLSSESFTGKAPLEVIEKERGKEKEYSEILGKLQDSLLMLK